MIDYIDKTDFEIHSNQLRQNYQRHRKSFTPVEIEQILIQLSRKGKLDYIISEIEPGNLGATKYNPVKNIPEINISHLHYSSDNNSTVNFTMAHELGHARYHTKYLKSWDVDNPQYMNLKSDTEKDKIFKMLEWQANYFAGAILVPKDEIIELHQNLFKNLGFIANDNNDKFKLYERLGDELTYKQICKWAMLFQVSPFVVSMRLRNLNLLNINGRSFITYNKSQKIVYGFDPSKKLVISGEI